MRWISFRLPDSREAVGIAVEGGYKGLPVSVLGDDLLSLIRKGERALGTAYDRLASQPVIAASDVKFLPLIPHPSKIICIGLNYLAHSQEAGFTVPDYPTVFARYDTSLVAHGDPIIRPRVSEQLDYEGELAVIIGRGGRHIAEADALGHVAGYSVFNDGSIRDYQIKTPQWTVGKTFDGTGAFGPQMVTPDELPLGCKGLRLETRLNGQIVQQASTDDLIFDVAKLISILSEAMTLLPGDVIVSGTPSGIGAARKPPLWMKPGDICEVSIEKVGTLSNSIMDEVIAPPVDERS